MALIICPDCSTEISDKEEVCKKCNRPISPQPKVQENEQSSGKSSFWSDVLIWIILGLVIFIGTVTGWLQNLLQSLISLFG